jgi:thymidylate synthase (FAD)
MPEDKTARIYDNPGRLYTKELPKTRFLDEIKHLKVTLVAKPDKNKLYSLFKNVAFGSWGKEWQDFTPEESAAFLKSLMSEGTLPLALEMCNFTFLIENVTRLTTHAIVRGRVGVTYCQQSTGNADQRHCDIMVPRSMSMNTQVARNFTDYCLRAKDYYAHAVDNGASVQEARAFLPVANANLIYVSFNLMSLMNFYSKRSDESEEYMQGNEICRQIKEIFDSKFPELSPILKSGCGRSCAHCKDSVYVNSVYVPSPADDKFNWNPQSFLYAKTRNEMCWNETPVATSFYVGYAQVTKEEYNK